ncbi:MAG: hypothetical protein IPP90_18695 [Gemmatimonadaceae bacterium]|nr:hypothetical protein [Gemmatimonadaceae bacterium]
MTTWRARLSRLVCIAAVPVLAAACDADTTPKGELRFRTDSFTVRISPESRPTRALDQVVWRITVHDRTTGTPIQGGQGRIFATSKDHKSIANGLEETGELGTYHATLMYVTAGMWAMALEFRRDSTQKLQRTEDWTQDILSANEPGDFTPPSSRPPDTTRRKVP